MNHSCFLVRNINAPTIKFVYSGFSKHIIFFYHKWQATPDGGWSGWNTLALNNLQPGLCVDRDRDARLEVFAIDTAGNVNHTWQPTPGGDPWGFENLGGANLGGHGVTMKELGFRAAWWFRE